MILVKMFAFLNHHWIAARQSEGDLEASLCNLLGLIGSGIIIFSISLEYYFVNMMFGPHSTKVLEKKNPLMCCKKSILRSIVYKNFATIVVPSSRYNDMLK